MTIQTINDGEYLGDVRAKLNANFGELDQRASSAQESANVAAQAAAMAQQTAAGKAPSNHTHGIGDVSGLQEELASKASSTHVHTTSHVVGLTESLAAKADLVGGKVPLAQIPDAVLGALNYQGVWDAAANSPAIVAAAASNKGWYYRVGTAGTTTINSVSEWAVGDWIVSNGATWEKADNSQAAPTPAEIASAGAAMTDAQRTSIVAPEPVVLAVEAMTPAQIARIQAPVSGVYARLEQDALLAAKSAGAALWYLGNSLSGVFEDSAGSIPAAVGSPIGLLRDRSGTGIHASQATTAKKPVVVRMPSGYFAVLADGVDDALMFDHTPFGVPPSMIAAGYHIDASGSSWRTLVGLSDGTATARYQIFVSTSMAGTYERNDAGAYIQNGKAYSLAANTPVVVSRRRGATTTVNTFNGGDAINGAPVASPFTFTRASLCADGDVGDRLRGGLILACVSPVEIGAVDRTAIERFAAYLSGVRYVG